MERVTSDGATCRICLGDGSDGQLFSPCKCKGSMKYVHKTCLDTWRSTAVKRASYYECDTCKYRYNLRRVSASNFLHKTGVVESVAFVFFLVLWWATSFALRITLGACMSTRWFAAFLFDELPFAGCSGLDTAIDALVVIGLIGFVGMLLFDCCLVGGVPYGVPAGMPMNDCCRDCQCDNCNCNCNNCCDDCCRDCPKIDSAKDCGKCAAIAIVFVILAAGLVRTIVFIYATLHAAAGIARDRVDKLVLDIRDAEPG